MPQDHGFSSTLDKAAKVPSSPRQLRLNAEPPLALVAETNPSLFSAPSRPARDQNFDNAHFKMRRNPFTDFQKKFVSE
ncbi:MAG: hypothetical protein KF767_02360 [Bdellovibrionaceae bacterium]|nr:hypothetical protein [Pseudobdellovibrionaceae bacterium]